MATAAIIGGGMLLGGIASGIGASKQAKVQKESAANALAASQTQQTINNTRTDNLLNPAMQAQQAQLGLLGQAGGDANAANNLLNSPLVSAINKSNNENINAQAVASGMSGGNLLAALQDRNTSTIMQAGFGGLSQVAGQQLGGALGFSGHANQNLQMANQAQTQYGNAAGAQAAAPWMTGANLLNQGTQLATFAASGGFGPQSVKPTGTGVGAANGAGGTINSPMSFSSRPLL